LCNNSFQRACDAAVGKNSSCAVTYFPNTQEQVLPPRAYCTYTMANGTSGTYPTDQCHKHWLPSVAGTKFPLSPEVEFGGDERLTFPSLAIEFFCEANRRTLASCRNPNSWYNSDSNCSELPTVLPFQGPFKAPRLVW
jgi:hypothetical protein